MEATAFIAGFFTALGFWTAGKLTEKVDQIMEPPVIEQQAEATTNIQKDTEQNGK